MKFNHLRTQRSSAELAYGFSAEFLMQNMLRDYLEDKHKIAKKKNMRFLRGHDRLSDVFFAKESADLNILIQRRSDNEKVSDRKKEYCIATHAECDAAVISGLHEDGSRPFKRLYCFDATTMYGQNLQEKHSVYRQRLSSFISAMKRERDVDVQIVNVAVFGNSPLEHMQGVRHSSKTGMTVLHIYAGKMLHGLTAELLPNINQALGKSK